MGEFIVYTCRWQTAEMSLQALCLSISEESPIVNSLANRRDPFAFFTRLAAEMGNFVRYRLPSGDIYFVNEPELIRQVLVREDAKFVKWAFNPSWQTVVGQGVLGSEGRLHQRMRRIGRPAFQPKHLPKYAQQMVALTQRRLGSWGAGGTIEIDREMVLLTLDIAANTLFGVAIGDWLERVRVGTRTAQRLSDRIGSAQADDQVFLSAVGELTAASHFILDERRRTGQPDEDLLALLLAGQKEIPEVITDEQICEEIRSYLLAAHVTTAHVLAAACWHLARDPVVLRDLQRSLDEALETCLPGMETLPALAPCEHVMLETLRLHPPIWVFGREAQQEVQIGGRALPRGAKLVIVPWVLHRDAERFPEPDRFLPARWQNNARACLTPGSYIPFSAGARGCMGEHFGLLEGTLILACLVSQWQLAELAARSDPGWSPQIVLWPRRGVRLQASHRHTIPSLP